MLENFLELHHIERMQSVQRSFTCISKLKCITTANLIFWIFFPVVDPAAVSYTKMSSQMIEKAEADEIFKNNERDFPLSSSYEAAMEALSSLITRQNRKDRSSIVGKYEKLERMSIYLEVLLNFHF